MIEHSLKPGDLVEVENNSILPNVLRILKILENGETVYTLLENGAIGLVLEIVEFEDSGHGVKILVGLETYLMEPDMLKPAKSQGK